MLVSPPEIIPTSITNSYRCWNISVRQNAGLYPELPVTVRETPGSPVYLPPGSSVENLNLYVRVSVSLRSVMVIVPLILITLTHILRLSILTEPFSEPE